MFVHKAEPGESYDPAVNLVYEFIQHWSRKGSPASSTAQSKNMALGRQDGFTDGCGAGLAVLVNALRVERYGNFGHVPILVDIDCAPFLAKAMDKYNEALANLTAKDDKQKAEIAWVEWLREELLKLTFPNHLEEAEKDRHMQAVLDGKEVATEDDLGWLRERQEANQKVLDDLDQIMTKASLPSYVNDGRRPIKDQPQA